jgi:hypothetical protein
MIAHSWLKERIEAISPDEVFRRELDQLGLSDSDKQQLLARASSQWAEKWQSFISGMIAGDEIWSFRSPPETWNQFAGAAGFAIVRSDCIVATITTFRS